MTKIRGVPPNNDTVVMEKLLENPVHNNNPISHIITQTNIYGKTREKAVLSYNHRIHTI